ncbi:hypothetical protein [Sphingomonas sp.]|uniref:hypothetical protein n=1 Tax=Sphingomonas sp. TaxID=28214 RepID=UPI0031D468B5
MKILPLWAGALALAWSSAAFGQTAGSAQAPAGFAPMQAPCSVQSDGRCVAVSAATPLPMATRVESFQLVSGNVPASPATLTGGTYILTQACTTYGSVTLRYRGPDGATMTAMLSKTASDSAGGSAVSFGGGAVVDIALSGTAGCNVGLSRVPQ